jgi:hypothetical protein
MPSMRLGSRLDYGQQEQRIPVRMQERGVQEVVGIQPPSQLKNPSSG